MKKYYIHHNGLVYAATAYGNNKREAIAKYREQWGLERKRINIQIWEAIT